MPQYIIKTFYKEQLYKSATKLPERIIEENNVSEAVFAYIDSFYPFLKRTSSDYFLVLENLEIQSTKDSI